MAASYIMDSLATSQCYTSKYTDFVDITAEIDVVAFFFAFIMVQILLAVQYCIDM